MYRSFSTGIHMSFGQQICMFFFLTKHVTGTYRKITEKFNLAKYFINNLILQKAQFCKHNKTTSHEQYSILLIIY